MILLHLVFLDTKGNMIHNHPLPGFSAPLPRTGEMVQVPEEFLEGAPRDESLFDFIVEPGGHVVQNVVHQIQLGEVHVLLIDARLVRRMQEYAVKGENASDRRPSHP